VIHVLLESAAACCACLIITLLTSAFNNAGSWVALEITPPVIVRRSSRFLPSDGG
jgi:hypothetical protein